MSPILVTIISFDFGFFCHQNWRKFKGITKIGDNFVENQCGLRHENFDPFCPLQNGKITPNMTACREIS